MPKRPPRIRGAPAPSTRSPISHLTGRPSARQIKIREVKETDLLEIKQLLGEHGHLFDPPYSSQAIETELGQLGKYRTGLVATHRGRLVGFVRYGHTPYRIEHLRELGLASLGQDRHGYIFSLLVHPKYSRGGIGTRLVEEAVGRIKGMEYPDGSRVGEVVMTHHEGNKGTARIGERLGFSKVKEFDTPGRITHRKTILLHKPILPHKRPKGP